MADVVTTPQLAVPFNINGAKVDVVEQGGANDRFNNVFAILHYEKGERTAIPEFGLPDQALRENGPNYNEIATAIRTWEPDAPPELIQRAIEEMTIGIQTPDDSATGA